MSNGKETMVIAIDGPSASGKSTVSKQVARELGFVYVDSGGLYRGMTWKAVRENVPTTDEEAVVDLMRHMKWTFFVEDNVLGFTIDDVNPGQEIRSEPVRENVSDIAAMIPVRQFIVERLRETTRFGRIVMEGRDIGSVVFPESHFKYYLDADPEERARRRHEELVKMEGKSDVNEVMNSLARRDKKDTTRKAAPLQIALGARVINSTSMTIEEVVAMIVDQVRSGME
ncbi:MAG: (d)CMP kinase [Spartobacteria bacterium]|nr:(d)CMP kinase [Spartobacteria bacterium]